MLWHRLYPETHGRYDQGRDPADGHKKKWNSPAADESGPHPYYLYLLRAYAKVSMLSSS